MALPAHSSTPATANGLSPDGLIFSDAALLRHYQADGNAAAFSALVERYQSMVLGVAFRRTGSAEIARDAAVQVFAALAQKAGFLEERSSLAGWLHQTAVHEATRLQHGKNGHNGHAAAGTHSQSWAGLEHAIDHLSSADRELVVLHYYQDLSHAEIAARLGVAETEVRVLTAHALSHLGTELRQRGISGEVTALLAGAVALQWTLTPEASLAQAALAAAAAGGGSSAFLTLTAVLGSSAVKTAVALVLTAALPAWWLIHHSHPSPANAAQPATLVAQSTSKTDSASPDRQPDVPSSFIGRRSDIPKPPTGATAILPKAGLITSAASVSTKAPASSPARQTGVLHDRLGSQTEMADRTNNGPVGTPPIDLPSLASELEASLQSPLSDELRSAVQQLELFPGDAAQLYTRLVQSTVALLPLEQQALTGLLEHYFEDLNLAGLAGLPPAPTIRLDWYAQRRSLQTDLLTTLKLDPLASVATDAVQPLLTLAEPSAAETGSSLLQVNANGTDPLRVTAGDLSISLAPAGTTSGMLSRPHTDAGVAPVSPALVAPIVQPVRKATSALGLR